MSRSTAPLAARRTVILVALTVLLIAPTLGHGLMLYDLGEVLFLTAAIRDGLTPGLDYAVNAYGPGRYLVLAGLFELFGAQLLLWDALLLAVRIGLSVALYALGARVVGSRWAWLPVICVLIAPGPLHKGFYLLGAASLGLALVCFLEAPTRTRAWLLGACVASVALVRLDLGGIGAILAVLACLPPGRRLHLPRTLGPVLAGAVAIGLWLAADGALGAVLRQVGHQIQVAQGMTWPGAPGLDDFARSPDPWFLLLVPLAIASVAMAMSRERAHSSRRRALAVVLWLGVATVGQVRSKPEWGHLLQLGPTLWLGLTVGLVEVARRRTGLAVAGAAFLVLALAAQTAITHRGSIYTGGFSIPWERTSALRTRLGTRMLNPGEYAELSGVLRALDAAPPGPLFVPTYQPALYALSGRRDVTGHAGVLFFGGSAARQRVVLDRLRARPPAVIAFADEAIEGPQTSLAAFAPDVLRWMEQTTTVTQRVGRWTIRIPRVEASRATERRQDQDDQP